MVDREAIQQFVSSGFAEDDYDALLQTLSAQPILDLVQALADKLTSTDDNERSRATLLLAQVSSASGQTLTATEQQHLSTFFASRLADWQCQRPAIQGCLAVAQLSQTCAPPLPFSCQTAAAVLKELLDGLNVQHLKQMDREACFKLLTCLLQMHGAQLLKEGPPSLLDVIAAALDGERDPRCLMLAFACVQTIAELHKQAGQAHVQEMTSKGEELCDILACYFPIAFTPPRDDPHGITREMLQAALQSALASCAPMASHIMPILLDGLSSRPRQGKVDALTTVGQCARAWGGLALAESTGLDTLWEALRPELLATPALEPDLDDDSADAAAAPAAASSCLTACLSALAVDGNGALTDLIMADTRIGRASFFLWLPTNMLKHSSKAIEQYRARICRKLYSSNWLWQGQDMQPDEEAASAAAQLAALRLMQSSAEADGAMAAAVCATVGTATAACSAEHQRDISQAAAMAVQQATRNTDGHPLAALAALSALRPGVLTSTSSMSVVRAATQLALSPGAEAAAIAAACVLNKWPSGSEGVAYHAQVAGFLWQQRAFTSALQALLSRLPSDWRQQPPKQPALLLALTLLMGGVPAGLYHQDLQSLLPLVMASLMQQSSGELPCKQGLLAAILVLRTALGQDEGRLLVEQHLATLLPCLSKLLSKHRSYEVRLAALEAVQACLSLPYPALHPHRTATMQAIALALDDPRRIVRAAAVRCRHAWATC
ncbi:hypothetical protein WJX73_007679 [Symbiochloris irregularis]|uniref:MMS19 nucleotide excision repair protein n=1 Tax=Symbiochloris irregularis TaxID=706552 RepID=A0AAW1P015_9CHLO